MAVLSLIPAAFIGIAASLGQLPELAVASAVAGALFLISWTGVRLLTGEDNSDG
ncbi:hypothetical protein [Streptomyces sp. NPDC049744]|uniref:hypothetical protein n=1 Tax=Streptomyces sp. NPDC049744 TaxID=3154359 RepID=UPI00342FCFF8